VQANPFMPLPRQLTLSMAIVLGLRKVSACRDANGGRGLGGGEERT